MPKQSLIRKPEIAKSLVWSSRFEIFFSHFLIVCALTLWPALASALSEDEARSMLDGDAPKGELTLSQHKGISLIGLPAPTGATFDVPIMKPDQALKAISEALSLIETSSPFSKSQIERLKKAGPVTIVYDPRYPDKLSNMASVQVALFSPHYYNKSRGKKTKNTFLVIVSRHGVKWPLKELAAVMVHELVGHGIQHLNNRWGEMRLIDMECEAWLYEEMAYQNMKIDKFSNAMVDFKKQLEKQCDSFLRYLRGNDPKGSQLWESLNPDVPRLLTHFSGYQKHLKNR